MKNKLILPALIIGIAVALIFINIAKINSLQKIALYWARCVDKVSANKCDKPVHYDPTEYFDIYQVNKDRQEVISWQSTGAGSQVTSDIKRYSNCAILDIDNWSCNGKFSYPQSGHPLSESVSFTDHVGVLNGVPFDEEFDQYGNYDSSGDYLVYTTTKPQGFK